MQATQTSSFIDMMIHVDHAATKPRLEERLAECPGVIAPRVNTSKPNLFFVTYDPRRFDIRTVPDIARTIGIVARIVET